MQSIGMDLRLRNVCHLISTQVNAKQCGWLRASSNAPKRSRVGHV